MFHRVEEDLFWLADLLCLVFHAHEHEIEELSHTRGVKLHNRAVGEFLEHFACADHGVHLLGFEELTHELFVKHGTDDIFEDLE